MYDTIEAIASHSMICATRKLELYMLATEILYEGHQFERTATLDRHLNLHYLVLTEPYDRLPLLP